jgi:hypothetical protein
MQEVGFGVGLDVVGFGVGLDVGWGSQTLSA